MTDAPPLSEKEEYALDMGQSKSKRNVATKDAPTTLSREVSVLDMGRWSKHGVTRDA
jgi:hypothetical protein